jgi:hypothetical protein
VTLGDAKVDAETVEFAPAFNSNGTPGKAKVEGTPPKKDPPAKEPPPQEPGRKEEKRKDDKKDEEKEEGF